MTEQFPALLGPAAHDIRSLSPQARAGVRREVVLAVRDGMTRLEAARRFGVSRRTVGVWVRAYRITGSEMLQERPRGRPSGLHPILTPDQQIAVLQLMRTGCPSLVGLEGPLWNRRSVRELIRIATGHRLDAGTIELYLRCWHLTSAACPEPELRRLRLSCHKISPPGGRHKDPPAAPEPWPVLAVEGGHGGIQFRFSTEPVGLDAVRAFGRHLAQQSRRPIRLWVWRWPDEHLDILRAWQADPGPGLLVSTLPE